MFVEYSENPLFRRDGDKHQKIGILNAFDDVQSQVDWLIDPLKNIPHNIVFLLTSSFACLNGQREGIF